MEDEFRLPLEAFSKSNRRILAAVVAQHGDDFIAACKMAGNLNLTRALKKLKMGKGPLKIRKGYTYKKEILEAGKEAEEYLFFNNDSRYVFSFKSVCKYLNVNPGKMRRRLLARLPEYIKKEFPKSFKLQAGLDTEINTEDNLPVDILALNQVKKTAQEEYIKFEEFLPKKLKTGVPRSGAHEDLSCSIGNRYAKNEILKKCQKCKESCKQTVTPGLTRLFCQKLGKELI